MNRSKWIWMPHAAHFIMARRCEFFLATCVGEYIVSTVGEYVPDEMLREIAAQVRRIVLNGRGDDRLRDYMKKVGYEEIGYNRKYETMVFPAVANNENKCCPFKCDVKSGDVDFDGYNDAAAAMAGHYALCEKWSDPGVAERELET